MELLCSMSDVPLGFGIAAKSTQDCRKLDPNGIVVLHQADIEDYLSFERLCLGNVGSFSACCFKLCLRFKICSLWNWVLDL
ncbi:hypothetical protein F2Q69_00015132 [Brassica cretica]|uniref:Uncharacterized protein n=1 Tax=Brassica cretica TaxID=69181 RepID=A0A8S9QP03_BRACR|nr:hypothetical protein F2Q69_00015132 [Brassica cretica]